MGTAPPGSRIRRSELGATAAGALALRGWALRALGGGEASPPPSASPGAWELFLLRERCALALRPRVRGLAPGAAAVVEERSTRELQRFMSARAQLQRLGAVLRAREIPAVVLKGGFAAAAGLEPVDVVDVDLLVPPERARELAAALDEGGWRRDAGADPEPGAAGAHELRARLSPGDVPVEIHFGVPFVGEGVDAWEGLVPTAVEGVRGLAPANQLWHALVHGVAHHLERRGALRELLMLRAALARCSPADLAEVERRVGAHPDAGVLARQLEMARALAEGRAPEDRFRRVAAADYLVRPLVTFPFPAPLWRAFSAASYALAAGGPEYGRLWSGGHSSALVPTERVGLRGIDRAAPGVARALRTVFRGAALAAGTLPALALARTAARLARASSAPP